MTTYGDVVDTGRMCDMTVHERTQVGIVGAGPAGLLLSHLLALGGIDSVCVENRSRAYCEAHQRAGMLESTTVDLLRAVGLGIRLDAEGLPHNGIYLQFDGERHHLDFRELTGGRQLMIYAQTEIVVPPTGAKGLNLAVADVTALATALVRLLRDGDPSLAAAYSDYCLERVRRSTHLSWWMTSMLHITPGQDQFESRLQLAQLRHLVTSKSAATMLAETYAGYAPSTTTRQPT